MIYDQTIKCKHCGLDRSQGSHVNCSYDWGSTILALLVAAIIIIIVGGVIYFASNPYEYKDASDKQARKTVTDCDSLKKYIIEHFDSPKELNAVLAYQAGCKS